MSRYLVLRCDGPACAQVTEVRASDSAPTGVDVPEGWLTVMEPARAHQHYCSRACLYAEALARTQAEELERVDALLAAQTSGRTLSRGGRLPEPSAQARPGAQAKRGGGSVKHG